MTPLDRALFRGSDALMLWLWNEWGVPWRSLVTGLFLAAWTANEAADAHTLGYTAKFWAWLAVGGVLFSLAIVTTWVVPPARMNAGNLRYRLGLGAGLWRWSALGWGVADALNHQYVWAVSNGAMLLALTAAQTMVPTGPRNPRPSTVLRPARARC